MKYYDNELENQYSEKTGVDHRRSLGQFFTPFEIAVFMSEWILDSKKNTLSILDPAAGFGVFERAMAGKASRYKKEVSFDLWEIDQAISKTLKSVLKDLGGKSNVFTSDFLSSGWDKKYDGIIANPPYYKHHHIKNKKRLCQEVSARLSSKFSLETNVYCWFLIKSINLLKIGGRLAFVVPAEFLNANYGEEIKAYLIKSGTILHIIEINSERKLFANALTTSVIIFAEKSYEKSPTVSFRTVRDKKELVNLKEFLIKHPKIEIDAQKLDPKLKWRHYFTDRTEFSAASSLVPLENFGRFSRGIATGSNAYFTLSRKDKEKWGIAKACLVPCVTKAGHLKDVRFTQEEFEGLRAANKKIYLFDGNKSNDESCQRYIKKGETEGVNKRYLTKKRNPWYSLEERRVSKIWASVFNRSGIKFIWNETSCRSLSCFHTFFPTRDGEAYLDLLFLYLNTDFARKLFDREKREYGGGLWKFEPNDLNKSLVMDFTQLPARETARLKKMQQEFLQAKTRNRKEVLQAADELLERFLE